MAYRILADIGEGYKDLDVDNSQVIAITYQAFNIADLEKSWAGGSNQIKLPRTPYNNRVFGFPDDAHGVLKITKQFTPCILEVDGVQICDSSSRLILQKADANWYYAEILHGTFNLFNALEAKSLQRLVIDSIRRDGTGVVNSWSSELATIPIADWHAEVDSSYNIRFADDENRVNVLGLIPFVYLKGLAESIVSTEGYSIKTGVDNENIYTKAAISLAGRTVVPASYVTDSGYTQTEVGFFEWVDNYGALNLANIGETFGNVSFSGGGTSLVFTPPVRGKYAIKLEGKFGNSGFMRVIKNPGTINLTLVRDIFSEVIDIELSPGDSILFIPRSSVPGATLNGFRVIAAIQQVDYKETESRFAISQNLPDWTQRDAVGLICKLYGLIPQVDGARKLLTLYNLNDVYDKIQTGEYRDWSDKLVAEAAVTEFHNTDYGQTNKILYTETQEQSFDNDGYANDITLTDSGTFELLDKTLQTSVELFTLEPKASQDMLYNMSRMLKARELRGGEPINETQDSVRIAQLDFINEQFTLRSKGGTDPDLTEVYTSSGLIARFMPMRAQILIDSQYSGLARMLDNAGKITAKFKLLPADVANFDFSKPVYISRYGSYFYVLKIQNYRADRLTVVEMMRL